MDQFFERLTITFASCAALCAGVSFVIPTEIVAYAGYAAIVLAIVCFFAYLIVPDSDPDYSGD